MAIVPLLVIRIMVMMAISTSGMCVPPTFSANTSLGFGQGTVVDMRTFMYAVRKHVKMNVSLSRKIHIIALPQGTGNACLSADQSAVTPCSPPSAGSDGVAATACSVMGTAILDVQVDSSSANSAIQTSSR